MIGSPLRSVSSKDVIERKTKKAHLDAAIGKQKQYRRMDSTDAGITNIKRDTKPSVKKQVVSLTKVKRTPQQRWQRSSEIPALPNPPGYQLKWIRKDRRNRGDGRGVSAHLREGWEFARVDDLPNEHSLPTQNLSTFGEVIGNDDMVLMKITEQMYAQRAAYYSGLTKQATEGVRQELEESDNSVMPFRKKRMDASVSFQRIRRKRSQVTGNVVVAEDEPFSDDNDD